MFEIVHGIKKILSLWRWWTLPALLSLSLAICFQDPFAGEWDSVDYSTFAISGWQPSSMFLGRMLFIFSNRIAYLFAHNVFGLRAEDAYLLFKYMVIAETPLTVLAMWALARELSGSVRTATIAALLLASSPYFVFLSGQAMTEIPSILAMCAALTLHLRGLRLNNSGLVILGAILLGLGANIREGVALYGTWLAVAPFVCKFEHKPDLRLTAISFSLFLITALGPFALWFGFNLGAFRDWWLGWFAAWRREAAYHPVSLKTFQAYFLLFFRCSPLVLVVSPYALWQEWRTQKASPLFLMGAIGLSANLLLLLHHSTIFHGRYFLTGLPGAAPLVADCLMRGFDQLRHYCARSRPAFRDARVGFLAATALIVAVGIGTTALAWPFQHSHQRWSIRWMKYRKQLEVLPRQNVVVMTNGMTNAVSYWSAATGADRTVIGCGTGWPGDDKLVETVDRYLKQGKQVFIDANPRVWSRRSHETRALMQLQGRFRFREITDTIYEIRPREDRNAYDDPHLETLSDSYRMKRVR